jgi:CheY-like chemotaxis protein
MGSNREFGIDSEPRNAGRAETGMKMVPDHIPVEAALSKGSEQQARAFRVPAAGTKNEEPQMSILIVTGIEGARNCAAVVGAQLGMEVEVADGRKAALTALRTREFAAVVVDETMAECDPSAAEAIWDRAGLAIPLQVNFALSGAARLTREIRAALHRREREQGLARRAAAAAIENELKTTVAGLLLHSQLALSGSESSSPIADKLRIVADLAGNLRQQLNSPALSRGDSAA